MRQSGAKPKRRAKNKIRFQTVLSEAAFSLTTDYAGDHYLNTYLQRTEFV